MTERPLQPLGQAADEPPPQPLPLYADRIAAGFPSPAEDYLQDRLDLNALLIRHPAATFFVRVAGESMIEAGIHPDDLLIVDRAEEVRPGRIVIAVLDGELTVKRLGRADDGSLALLPANAAYPPLPLRGAADGAIWGVVTCVIHPL